MVKREYSLFNLKNSALSVYFCSGGLLLQRKPPADLAAAADGHLGLHWDALLLRGGEDAELLSRFTGTLGEKKRQSSYEHCFVC